VYTVQNPDKSPRFYEIDLLRAIAAVGVVLFHYTFRGHAGGDNLCDVPFEALGGLFQYGYLGVDLFFIISGFVILLTAMDRDPAGFVISRVVRLYPTFWVAVTLTTVAAWIIGQGRYTVSVGQYLANLTMVSGAVGVPPVDAVYWSLLVEIRFYFLVFIIMVLGYKRRIELCLGAWMIVTCLLSFLHTPHVLHVLLFPEWSSYFIAGAMFYLIARHGVRAHRLAVIAAAYGMSLWHACGRVSEFRMQYGDAPSGFVIAIFITLFFGLFLLVASGKTSRFSRKGMLVVGGLTYPLYLIHENVGFMLFNVAAGWVNKYVLLLGITISMILAAYAINLFVERKMTRPFKNLLTSIVSAVALARRTVAAEEPVR
jgi:peptidoglycan/LPS O-acetylase OafA/YrhL